MLRIPNFPTLRKRKREFHCVAMVEMIGSSQLKQQPNPLSGHAIYSLPEASMPREIDNRWPSNSFRDCQGTPSMPQIYASPHSDC